jgi:hypothetical protein
VGASPFIYKIDPVTGNVVQEFYQYSYGMVGLGYGDNYLWASGMGAGPFIYKIDPATGNVVQEFYQYSYGMVGLGYGDNYLWASGMAGASPFIYKIDPATGNVVQEFYQYSYELGGLDFDDTSTGVEEPEVDLTWRLAAARNPAHGRTEIGYTVPAGQAARLAAFDVNGTLVSILADRLTGNGSVVWNLSRVHSGTYLCRLTAGKSGRTTKVVVAR